MPIIEFFLEGWFLKKFLILVYFLLLDFSRFLTDIKWELIEDNKVEIKLFFN